MFFISASVRAGMFTLWVCLSGKLQRITGGQVCVGRGDRQDETGLPTDVGHDHVPDLLPDVWGLVPQRQLGQARQVNQCDV